ncbi:molecular chaperone [Streptomyces sp. NPDC050315]|uniref:fimbrial biogenesis chaperone n=1 Tax=Streptomyces sp. NPDC050315 TaxID=3155039 RepID=UPI003440F920
MTVTADRARVVFDAGALPTSVVVSNGDSEEPRVVQVYLASDRGAPAGKERLPFAVSPAHRSIQPGDRQAFRITYEVLAGTPLPSDRETLLYFCILAIPPQGIQSAEQTWLDFLYRPKGLSGTPVEAAKGLQFSAEDGKMWVRNPSYYCVSVAEVTVDGVKIGGPLMVRPRQQELLDAPNGKGAVEWSYIDDYGARHCARQA